MRDRIHFNYAQRWRAAHQKIPRYSGAMRLNAPLIICCLLVLAFTLSPWIWEYKLEYDLSRIESYLTDYTDVSAVDLKISQLQSDISKRYDFLKLLEEKKKDPHAVLEKIKKLLPTGTDVTSFALAASDIDMTVIVSGPVDLAKLWISFRDSGLFEGFDISSVSLIDEKQTLHLSFKLKQL